MDFVEKLLQIFRFQDENMSCFHILSISKDIRMSYFRMHVCVCPCLSGVGITGKHLISDRVDQTSDYQMAEAIR